MNSNLTVYKDGGERTHKCESIEEKEFKLSRAGGEWWETPLWQIDPRPYGLSNENPYEKVVPTAYQEFPRTMHKGILGTKSYKSLTVHDAAGKATALKGGYTETPAKNPALDPKAEEVTA